MTSLFTLKGKIKADFKLIDKLILDLSDNDRKQIYKFLDKQIEISYEAGKKEAIMVNKIVTPHLKKQMLKLINDSLKIGERIR